jgi:predicted RNA-binding Zn ribbon-like protein
MSLQVPPKILFLFVGNQTCLDFINTDLMLNGQPTDLLTSFEDLLAWLVEADCLTAEEATQVERQGSRQGTETLKQAKAFRATRREMVGRMADHKPVPQAALDAINRMLRHRAGFPQVTRRGATFERTYQADLQDSKHVLGLLAEAASDLLCMCERSLIKKCHHPSCVLFFYDTTKNHGRHWCSMNLCGNRSKVAAHYHRHRKRKK